MSGKASGSDGKANGDAKSRSHHDGSSGRAFTVEQKAAVLRVRKCAPTAFYDILGLESVKTTCSEGEIKKAYRKLSLLTHPDKNGYDGADEAFKMVSRAFQILSDADKKSRYDKFGGDPDNRMGGGGGGGGGAPSPFSGFAQSRGGQRGGMFEEEISPEEMFRQFFGGGMGGPFGGGGGLFDTGPQFMFNMGGGPGIRIRQFGGNQPRRRPHNHADAEPQPRSTAGIIQSLLPLILLFILPLLSSIFGGDSTPSGPYVRVDTAVPPHTLQHVSNRLKIPYWVNPVEVQDYTSSKWRSLDKEAEQKYVGQLNVECEVEHAKRTRLVNEAQGFFFTDQTKMDQARRMDMKSCRRLNELGIRT